MNKIALLIGRFQPIHEGHLKMIERYSKSGFFIKVGVGSADKSFEKHNPLTFEERRKKITLVLKEAKIKKFKIYPIGDIKNDSKYVNHVRKIVGNFDVIITGNPRVLKLFKEYRAKSPWNIESFEESKRPGGNITSGIIRKRWSMKSSKLGLRKSSFNYLKSIDFCNRLKTVNSKNSLFLSLNVF